MGVRYPYPYPTRAVAQSMASGDARGREAALLATVSCEDFAVRRLLGTGFAGALYEVAILPSALPRFPYPGKPYTLKAMLNYIGAEDVATVRDTYSEEFRRIAAVGPHPNILRLFATFVDTLPREMLELLPTFIAECIPHAGQDGPLTQFAVLEYHACNAASLKRVCLCLSVVGL